MQNITEKILKAPVIIKIVFIIFMFVIVEYSQSLVLLFVVFAIMIFLVYGHLNETYKDNLEALSSIIKGNVVSSFILGKLYIVLDGIWNDKKVKIGISKVANANSVRGIFIMFYSTISNFIPMKVRPAKGILGTLNLPLGWHAAKKMKLKEYDLEILSQTDNEEIIRNILTQERIKIIKYFFDKGFSFFEVGKDDNGLIYLKLEIEISHVLEGKEGKINNVLEVREIEMILQKMKEFSS